MRMAPYRRCQCVQIDPLDTVVVAIQGQFGNTYLRGYVTALIMTEKPLFKKIVKRLFVVGHINCVSVL